MVRREDSSAQKQLACGVSQVDQWRLTRRAARRLDLVRVAVGTALAGGPPRRSQRAGYCTGLLPWMVAKRACGNGCTVRVWGIHRVAMRFILSQVIRVRWLRRRSALRQCRISWVRKAFTASLWPSTAPRSKPGARVTTAASHRPWSGRGRHARRLISAFTSASLARTRFESVFRLTQNRPLGGRAEVREPAERECLRFPLAPCRPVPAACRPNSISRVFPGCSSSPDRASLPPGSSRNRSASCRCPTRR